MAWRQTRGMATPKNGDSGRPEAIEPVPEHYAGHVHAYRGTEDHGVTPHEKDVSIPDFSEESPGVVYLKAVDEMAPIPVRIVTVGSKELRRWRINYFWVDATTMVQLCGRDESRTKITIRNMAASGFCYLANEPHLCNDTFGFPIGSREVRDLNTEDPIYIYSVAGAPISILEEYTVQE